MLFRSVSQSRYFGTNILLFCVFFLWCFSFLFFLFVFSFFAVFLLLPLCHILYPFSWLIYPISLIFSFFTSFPLFFFLHLFLAYLCHFFLSCTTFMYNNFFLSFLHRGGRYCFWLVCGILAMFLFLVTMCVSSGELGCFW